MVGDGGVAHATGRPIVSAITAFLKTWSARPSSGSSKCCPGWRQPDPSLSRYPCARSNTISIGRHQVA
jgi:hypothetical protein